MDTDIVDREIYQRRGDHPDGDVTDQINHL